VFFQSILEVSMYSTICRFLACLQFRRFSPHCFKDLFKYEERKYCTSELRIIICLMFTNLPKRQQNTSAADPWHFVVDPDPDLDPRIHASD
jgi:hypothetical protein